MKKSNGILSVLIHIMVHRPWFLNCTSGQSINLIKPITAQKMRYLARKQTEKTHQNGRHYRKIQNFGNRNKTFLTHVPRYPQPKNQVPSANNATYSPRTDKKRIKMAAIIVKIKILKIGKKPFLLMSQGVLNQTKQVSSAKNTISSPRTHIKNTSKWPPLS